MMMIPEWWKVAAFPFIVTTSCCGACKWALSVYIDMSTKTVEKKYQQKVFRETFRKTLRELHSIWIEMEQKHLLTKIKIFHPFVAATAARGKSEESEKIKIKIEISSIKQSKYMCKMNELFWRARASTQALLGTSQVSIEWETFKFAFYNTSLESRAATTIARCNSPGQSNGAKWKEDFWDPKKERRSSEKNNTTI